MSIYERTHHAVPYSDLATKRLDNKPAVQHPVVRVVAIRQGHDGQRLREPGEIFDLAIDPKAPAPVWCRPVDEVGDIAQAIHDANPEPTRGLGRNGVEVRGAPNPLLVEQMEERARRFRGED